MLALNEWRSFSAVASDAADFYGAVRVAGVVNDAGDHAGTREPARRMARSVRSPVCWPARDQEP